MANDCRKKTMKLLEKYYRWRAKRAKSPKREHFRLMAYYCSDFYRKSVWRPFDLTRHSDPKAWKEELTADIGVIEPTAESRKITYKNELKPGRYLIGPQKWVKNEETEKWEDKSDWRETPLWWSDEKEANEQFMPSRRNTKHRIVSYKFRNDGSGRKDPYYYNYQTGKQEPID